MQDYHDNKHIECKIMTGGLDSGSRVLYNGIVRDGVRCGENSICINQTCRDIYTEIQRHTKCPENVPPTQQRGGRPVECSDNGVGGTSCGAIGPPRFTSIISPKIDRIIINNQCKFSY